MRGLIATLAATVAISLAPVSLAQTPLTGAEVLELSADELRQRTIEEALADLQLSEASRRRLEEGRSELGWLAFDARPRITTESAVCAIDVLTLFYEPVDGRQTEVDRPNRLSHFEASATYHVLAPESWRTATTQEQRTAWAEECEGLSRETAHFFWADDEQVAIEATRLYRTALDAVAAQTNAFPVVCIDDGGSDCTQPFLDRQDFQRAQVCGSFSYPFECFRYSSDFRRIEIHLTPEQEIAEVRVGRDGRVLTLLPD